MAKKKKNAKKQNPFRITLNPSVVVGVLVGSCFLLYPFLGSVYIIVVLIVCIFVNLGDKEGAVSAYSVFNKGRKYLVGDLRMHQIDKELSHKAAEDNSDDDNVLTYEDMMNNGKQFRKGVSRYNNKKCPCGSNKKFKKCCGQLTDDSSDL